MSSTETMLTFYATNVTGTQELPVEVRRDLPAETVAQSLASLMSMPDNVPCVLRDDGSSSFLKDREPIGDQIEPGTRVTVTPKAHLGGGAPAGAR